MRLFDFILENMESILLEWERFAREVQPADSCMGVSELRDHAGEMLRVIAADMQVPQTEREQFKKSKGEKKRQAADTAAEVHAIERLESGFSISLLAAEYRALRASVLKLWSRHEHGQQSHTIEDIIRFNEAVDQALAESVERYSEALAMQQDVFVGILGHDLRTPLQSLSAGAQLLMYGGDVDSKLIQLGARMYRSVTRMTGMIDNLLDFTKSRIGEGMDIDPEEAELAAVAEQVVEEFRSYNPDREIRYEIKGSCVGDWDIGRVAQVFQNLIGNAIQYGAKGTPVTVGTEDQPGEVIIRIHNHGTPITKSEQQRLFDLLHRHAHAAKEGRLTKNLGLGLYIVREIAVAHGGKVSVTSSEKSGTEFVVRLPKRRTAESTESDHP